MTLFTGIVTDIGTIVEREERGDLRLWIRCTYPLDTVALGASIACSGACLTVVDKRDDQFAVDLSAETLARTAPRWAVGQRLNLERALRLGDELGGHLVTGHVDAVGTVDCIEPSGDSTRLAIAVPHDLGRLVAAKGSITIDGVSLTVNHVEDRDARTVASINLIPHTGQVTTLGAMAVGDGVNVEIDVLARYLQRMNHAAM